ncbi:NADP-dependent L-serine/L-allo-threonine dehydrogenase ydfG [Aureobasidium pullulans EXF-150]|uniref:NADP-dependent L-serine/L-allo-threonine dehydrogenase ydfG n=1 Tax=Aureobasidium pullulans EXF-150 TaxID=1043002 RepID=A0A074YE27_AURPU|nr:NADP-dependent L-serine/L-allo-threonine dehydrogenase ydfG [Aureobasidium pullulans EXF-150]KEQ85086.1 NADP-dependent L-serine/L-allo-threonine dehydrogenase ydfG [Aureobasidium pullulans EXF-150]
MPALKGQLVLLTGASMGIGAAIARSLAASGANLALFSRSDDKLQALAEEIKSAHEGVKVTYRAVDVGDHEAVDNAVASVVKEMGEIDVLINNAGLALGAPNAFPDLKITDIITMNNTNINGYMFVTYSVLNHSMRTPSRHTGTILNITSTTALEAPPFPGEAVYHANKACQEGFTNALRNELCGTDIRVLALRPGVVGTHFHRQRVGFDDGMYDDFMDGYRPLVPEDVAESAIYMLNAPMSVSIKALDVVPSAQRSLTVFDREWSKRNEKKDAI